MAVVALIIAIVGVITTVIVGYLVHIRTRKALRRIDASLIASKSSDEVHQIERLLEDIERAGSKRGKVVQREDGSWGIDWKIVVGSNSPQDEQRHIWNTILTKLKRNLFSIPFIIALLFGVGYLIYIAYQIPLNTTPVLFTERTRLTYVLYSIASVLVFLAALFSSSNKWIKLLIMLAIYAFFAGMIIHVLTFLP